MLVTKTKNRTVLLNKKYLTKTMQISKETFYINKFINWSTNLKKIGISVFTNVLGKNIHDSERNRKRKAKKKNNKIMGQVSNLIGMHLALITLWRYLILGKIFGYNRKRPKIILIFQFKKNCSVIIKI